LQSSLAKTSDKNIYIKKIHLQNNEEGSVISALSLLFPATAKINKIR